MCVFDIKPQAIRHISWRNHICISILSCASVWSDGLHVAYLCFGMNSWFFPAFFVSTIDIDIDFMWYVWLKSCFVFGCDSAPFIVWCCDVIISFRLFISFCLVILVILCLILYCSLACSCSYLVAFVSPLRVWVGWATFSASYLSFAHTMFMSFIHSSHMCCAHIADCNMLS